MIFNHGPSKFCILAKVTVARRPGMGSFTTECCYTSNLEAQRPAERDDILIPNSYSGAPGSIIYYILASARTAILKLCNIYTWYLF